MQRSCAGARQALNGTVVPSPPANLSRHFLGWETPLLPQAVAWFARDWDGRTPLDLSSALVIVPTRQAGRRLRAALAEHAAGRGQAVFPPRVIEPKSLVAPPADAADVATALESTLAWTQVLLDADLDAARAVFPVDPPERSFAWALRLAEKFTRLQGELAEGELRLEDVAARAPADFAERARWVELGELGRQHAAALRRRGKVEPQQARLRVAAEPPALAGIARIVLLAVPDPLPLALTALAHHGARVPIDVLVAAPADEAAAFDAWGRPLPASWERRDPPWTDFSAQVRLLPDAVAQAEWLAQLARRYPQPDGSLGLGVAAAEIAPLAENALERGGVAAFNPAGEPHRAHGFFQFLAALADFGREPTFEHTLALARAPETLDWLTHEFGGGFRAAEWLQQLDELHAEHLPATLFDARRHARAPAATRGLALLAELRDTWAAEDFATGAERLLTRIFAGRRLDPARAEDRRFADAAEAWAEVVRECAAAAAAFASVRREEWWEIALRRFGETVREAEKPAGAVELQGWLELPFEDAPHLVIAGANDGAVPDAVVGDAFLPESLRAQIGLKTNAARFARDACVLHALVASRRAGGRVDVLLGKTSAAGDPLKPSRLLLQCRDADLPARIAHLFRPLESRAALPAWERAWVLRPRRSAAPGRVSVTGFRSYLACPFRFFLRHVLKMEALDAGKRELDVFDFGRLCHTPLEKFAEPPWRDCKDEATLAAMLVEELDREARARFGDAPTVPVVAQLESARQRLRWAARVQAAQRAEGWVVHAIERGFEVEIGGLKVRGQIDRIDRHERTGAWRVVDYKTSDAAKRPVEAHLDAPWDCAPAWARVTVDGRERQWIDLQLPLYLHALPSVVPEATGRAACGYFNLPKAATATVLAEWTDYTPELHADALRCAEQVAAAVRGGVFWPPNEEVRPDDDDFAALFHRGVAESVEWSEVNQSGRKAPPTVSEVSS